MLSFKQYLMESRTGVKNFDDIISTLNMLHRGKYNYQYIKEQTGQKVLRIYQEKKNMKEYSNLLDYIEKFGYKRRIIRKEEDEAMDNMMKKVRMDMGLETIVIILRYNKDNF